MSLTLLRLFIPELVMALIDGAYDKDPGARHVIATSLCDIGKQQPTLVLSSCHAYLQKHVKVVFRNRRSNTDRSWDRVRSEKVV